RPSARSRRQDRRRPPTRNGRPRRRGTGGPPARDGRPAIHTPERSKIGPSAPWVVSTRTRDVGPRTARGTPRSRQAPAANLPVARLPVARLPVARHAWWSLDTDAQRIEA